MKFGLPYYGIGLILLGLISAQLNDDFTRRHFIMVMLGLILLTVFGIRKAREKVQTLKKENPLTIETTNK